MLKKTTISIAAALASWAAMSAATAAELADGTVISKANLDQVRNDTFMGHKIGDLVTPVMEREIREFNRTFPLKKAAEPVLDPKFAEATKKYAAAVKFDAGSREISGYQAGVPFPAVDASDASAGDKVLWNYYYGAPNYAQDVSCPVYFVTVNKSGYESSQLWQFERVRNRGRIAGNSHTLEDADWLYKQLFVGVAPQDIKGIGTYTLRYDSAKLDELFVYVKSVRRTRRLTGNAWADPGGPGFDFLNDDLYVFNSRPSRYVANKLVGKRWILAVTTLDKVERNAAKAGTKDEFPHIDTTNAPNWNPVLPYTPREVYVVEATPPAEHPYSKKVVYVDAKLWNTYRGEFYDKKGDLWKVSDFFFNSGVKGKTTGVQYINSDAGWFGDYKLRHATHFIAPCVPDSGLKPSKFSAEQLETYQ